MAVLLNVIVPVFGVAALGFLAARFRLLTPAGVQGLVLFVFDFAIPVLLFRTLATIALPAHIEWSFLAAFYTGSAATYALGMAAGRAVFKRPFDQAAIFGMSAAFCNTVFMGIPVILTAFGPEATLPLFLIISFHAATLMPAHRGRSSRDTAASGCRRASRRATW